VQCITSRATAALSSRFLSIATQCVCVSVAACVLHRGYLNIGTLNICWSSYIAAHFACVCCCCCLCACLLHMGYLNRGYLNIGTLYMGWSSCNATHFTCVCCCCCLCACLLHRGYLNFGTLYICWLCSAVFCHLPSLESLGIDIKADVSLGLSIAASSFLVSAIE
jgi:hypothetical protein